MSFSNACHNYPVLCRKGGSHQFLERGGTLMGIFDDARFEEESVQLAPVIASCSIRTASTRR
jgi:serine phosphatase RsbU (regulator of sigma subunit)